MKTIRQIFTILLTVYLLFLMAMPCSDEHESANEQNYISQSSDNSTHADELCTPFCICSSCIASFVHQPSFEFDFIIPQSVYNNRTQSFYQSVKSSFFGSIWQPPKIA
ncbi:MAG: hypothetical protein DI539_02105 [Flavobacterium psychrophilum]|nr:MAG: hypothetical protein DI539_02105 [Flavobacterium psychrophilum]